MHNVLGSCLHKVHSNCLIHSGHALDYPWLFASIDKLILSLMFAALNLTGRVNMLVKFVSYHLFTIQLHNVCYKVDCLN